MSMLTIQASIREAKGKGAVQRLRQQGLVPGVVYGGAEGLNLPIQLSQRELSAALTKDADSAFFTLQLDDGSTHLVLPREIQYSKIKRDLLHIDFQVVARDEEVRTTVPVRFVGENQAPLQYGLLEIELKAKPAHVPAGFDVDISGLEVGQTITVADLEIPAGVELISSPEEMVVSVVASTQEPVDEEGDEEAEAAGETAEEPQA
ncbi:MAG: 50S ribosomal protein L25 [Firmicutes bacterium]|nr:50S ribosomal protein L25 [Bacillota bacterium]